MQGIKDAIPSLRLGANEAVRASDVTPNLQVSSPPPTDADLVRDFVGGDERAFHLLVDRHGPRLFRLARSLCGSAADAEDLVQETFTGAFRGFAKFEQRSSVATWLSRILITQTALWRRRRRAFAEKTQSLDAPTSGDGYATPKAPGSAGGTLAVDFNIDLQTALAAMAPEYREVIVLREVQGLSYREITEVLQIPQGTVESRLHRARADLRERLKVYQ